MSQGNMLNVPTRFPVTSDISMSNPLNPPARARRRRRSDRHAVYFEMLEERALFSGSPPTVSNFSLALNDNTSIVVGATDFQTYYSDPEIDPMAAVEIVSLPTNGNLTLTVDDVTNPVTQGQVIDAADLDGLQYNAGAVTGLDTFQWNASDGTSFADNPATVTMNVLAPSIVDVQKTTSANIPITFSIDDFTNAYTSDNALQFVDIESLPAHGVLTLNGSPITSASADSPDDISAADIGGLVYTPNANYTNTSQSADSFAWVANDGSVSSASANVNITVSPDLTGFSASLKISGSVTLQASQFTAAFSRNPFLSLTVTSLPQHGTLNLLAGTSSTPITLNQVISSGDFGNVEYSPTANYAGSDSFQFTAFDGNYTSNTANVTLNISSYYTAISKNVDENVPLVFTQGDFTNNFSATLQKIEITRLPSYGNLYLTVNNKAQRVTLDQTISADQLADLSYKAPNNFTGSDSFLWQGSVDGTTFAPLGSQVSLTVEAAALSNISKTVGEDNPFSFAGSDFTNALNGAGALTSVKLTSLPQHGTLTLSGNSLTLTANQTLSADQIGSLVYTPDTHFVGNDSFKFTASDGQAFVSGGAQVGLNVGTLLVTGNGVSIANGDKSPTSNDFTDFGTDVIASDTGPTFTRTYVLTNLTGGTLNLTAGGNLVQITGPDANDFSVATPLPEASLAPGGTTSFTINFAPIHTGAQHATISLPFATADGASAFTFAIQGTGATTIKNINSDILNSTAQTYTDNQILQATSQGGKGNLTAQNGDIVYLTYTGRLLDGTVFDASSLHGNVPIAIRLDDTGTLGTQSITAQLHAQATNSAYSNLNTFASSVIAGWNFGLQGIKPGEHRTLIIPSDFGYGDSGTTGIPGGATIEFDVVCQGIDDAPSWGITNSNTGTAVFPGSKTASQFNGTDFGVLPAGQTYIGQTFYGTNNSPVSSSGVPLAQIQNTGFKITGPDAKDFIATGTFGDFTLYFKPTAPGVRTATIHFLTNDPAIKDFNFVVKGTSTPNVDLFFSATGTKSFPSTTNSNGNVTTTLPITVENFGNVPIPASTPTTDIVVTAYNANDTSAAGVVIGQISDAGVVGLASGKTKTFNVPVTITPDLAQAGYNLVFSINSSQSIFDAVTSNNSSTTSENVTGSLISTTIPTHIVDTSGGIDGKVVVQVKNTGQYTLPSNEQVSVQLQVLNTNASTTTLIGAPQIFSVGNMTAGGSQSITLVANSTISLSDGSYQIQAVITPTPILAESSLTDNTVSQTAASGTLGFTSQAPSIDLAASFGSASGGSASTGGGNVKLKIPVTIKNNGNIPVSATASTTDVQIFLHDTTTNSTVNTLIGTIAAQNIKGLAPDATTTVNVPVTIPLTMTGDTFTYIATINQAQNAPITDVNPSNNSASATMNVSGNLVSSTLPGTITRTSLPTKGVLNIKLLNSGTLAFPTGETIRVELIAHSTTATANADTVIATLSESTKAFLNPAANSTVSLKFTLPHKLTVGTYDLEAQLVPSPSLAQSNTSDDLAALTAASGTVNGSALVFTIA